MMALMRAAPLWDAFKRSLVRVCPKVREPIRLSYEEESWVELKVREWKAFKHGGGHRMAEKFRAHIYGVKQGSIAPSGVQSTNLRTTMARAWAEPPEDRVFTVSGVDYRLEHYEEKLGLCFLNFAVLQYSGPGWASLNQSITSFNLNRNDRFAYQTAMLYDYHQQLAFIQSSRPGMTASAISKYLTNYVWHEGIYFQFNPILDENARIRALQHHVIRNLEMRVAIRDFTQEDRDFGVSLGEVMSWGEGYGARHMDIKMSVGRGKGSLTVATVRELVQTALGTLEPGHELEKLKLTCRSSMDERTEVIDLLQHREHRDLELQVDPRDRTIPHKNRWRALEKVRLDFLTPT